MEILIFIFFVVIIFLITRSSSSEKIDDPPITKKATPLDVAKNYSSNSNTKSSSSNINSKDGITRCIKEKKIINFNYEDEAGNKTNRTVSPKEMFLSNPSNRYASRIYVVEAHCHLRNAKRTFLLKRMSKIKIV